MLSQNIGTGTLEVKFIAVKTTEMGVTPGPAQACVIWHANRFVILNLAGLFLAAGRGFAWICADTRPHSVQKLTFLIIGTGPIKADDVPGWITSTFLGAVVINYGFIGLEISSIMNAATFVKGNAIFSIKDVARITLASLETCLTARAAFQNPMTGEFAGLGTRAVVAVGWTGKGAAR